MFDGLVSVFYGFVDSFGYFGIFLSTLIASGTFLPIPSRLFVFIFAKNMNPILVSFVASIGASLGEFTGYAVGFGSRLIVGKRHEKLIKRWEQRAKKYGLFWVLVLFGATPLPDDVPGAFAGLMKYDKKKFFLAVFLGKMIMHIAVAYSGRFFLNWVM